MNGILLVATWKAGGTDYGGCAGRHIAFDLTYKVQFPGSGTFGMPPNAGTLVNTEANSWGVFGKVNKSTTFAQIRDGLSNVIMTARCSVLSWPFRRRRMAQAMACNIARTVGPSAVPRRRSRRASPSGLVTPYPNPIR